VIGISYEEPVVDSIKQKKMETGIKKIAQGLSEVIQALGTDSVNNRR
jgi:hypothetical protein